MVENLNPSGLIFMAGNEPLQLQTDTSGFGVLDLGATETVGSLEAIEKVLQLRQLQPGEFDEVRVMPNAKKMFRFGNGEVKQCESYLLLPQHVGSKKVLLGIYTLMAEKVPILIGMRTLTRLGAIIDVPGFDTGGSKCEGSPAEERCWPSFGRFDQRLDGTRPADR